MKTDRDGIWTPDTSLSPVTPRRRHPPTPADSGEFGRLAPARSTLSCSPRSAPSPQPARLASRGLWPPPPAARVRAQLRLRLRHLWLVLSVANRVPSPAFSSSMALPCSAHSRALAGRRGGATPTPSRICFLRRAPPLPRWCATVARLPFPCCSSRAPSSSHHDQGLRIPCASSSTPASVIDWAEGDDTSTW